MIKQMEAAHSERQMEQHNMITEEIERIERELKIAKEEEVRKRKKIQPSSHQLYDEKETPNKILEKNQQQKAEVFELEVDDESDDEEELNKTILAKLKTLGISQNEVKIKKPEENMDKSNLEELKEEDISKYIGGEEVEDNDKLFD